MSRYVCNVVWDDVPHLSQAEKDELYAAIPAYQRSARTKGMPILGSGLVYPFDEERLKVDPLQKVPDFWARCFGLDTDAGAGYTATAAAKRTTLKRSRRKAPNNTRSGFRGSGTRRR
jgi:hypothetical protein